MAGDQIWAPWRIDYILDENKAKENNGNGCLFCDLPRSGDQQRNLILRMSHYSYVLLNRYPYSSCHLLVIPFRHVRDLEKLEDDEYLDLMQLLRNSISCLKKAVNPAGINAGINLGQAAGAGIAEHLHFHLVPRWTGDHNFMPVIADTMVMPEHLDSAYSRLKPFFT